MSPLSEFHLSIPQKEKSLPIQPNSSFLQKLIFVFSPVLVFRVKGQSMFPTYSSGEKLIVLKTYFFHLSRGDVVILFDPRTHKMLLKRIKKRQRDTYFVVGDNEKESTDSRVFGWVDKKKIVGKVIYPKKV